VSNVFTSAMFGDPFDYTRDVAARVVARL